MTYWKSQFGFIMATIGAAVGLGNIWKFPYEVGIHGGGAFMALYLFFVFIMGLPLLLGELSLGYYLKNDALTGLKRQFPKRPFYLIGLWGFTILILVFSFYSVVSGWCLAYLYEAAVHGLPHTPKALSVFWTDLLSKPSVMLIYHTLFVGLTGLIVAKGIQSGIERCAKLLMPLLFGLLGAIAVFNLVRMDCGPTLRFLFQIRAADITSDSIQVALGQAFFSLATGAGCMCIYGAYQPSARSLSTTSLAIVLSNVLMAILSGLAIFPMVFQAGLNGAGGPQLMFETLPLAIHTLGLGSLPLVVFFCALVFAALTSSVSLVEPIVAALRSRYGLSRALSVCVICGIVWLLGALCVLSFNVLSHIPIFDGVITLSTRYMLPIGGLAFALLIGWVMDKAAIKQATGLSDRVFALWYALIKYSVPIGMGVVLVL
jgi:NSS family neurotransmitter:Na+ symporter